MKHGKFLDWLKNYFLPKKGTASGVRFKKKEGGKDDCLRQDN